RHTPHHLPSRPQRQPPKPTLFPYTTLFRSSATQIRRGMVIVFEGQPCKVVEFRHHTPGNLRAMIQTKLRNIRTGSSFEHRFRSADTVERAALEQHEMEYLYSDGSHHHFMNTETFDQVSLSADELGDTAQWLWPALK